MESVLRAEKLIRNYKLPNAEEDTIKVLKGLDFVIEQNEFVGIMGKSGCGKTTLLKLLGLIERPTGGEMYFKEKKVKELWEDELADLRRRKIGFVFQDFYLMDSLTVEENIMLPMILDKAEEESCYESARGYAEHFRINALMRKYPYELSGGERQRVAICRALVNRPDLILADEPTGALDSRASGKLLRLLEEVNRRGTTVLVVTHNREIVDAMKKRVVTMKKGVIISDEKKGGYIYED